MEYIHIVLEHTPGQEDTRQVAGLFGKQVKAREWVETRQNEERELGEAVTVFTIETWGKGQDDDALWYPIGQCTCR